MRDVESNLRIWTILGALFAFLAVAGGAFGAHALKNHLSPNDLSTFEIGVRYQMYHALGLFVVGWLVESGRSRPARVAGVLFCAGILVFCGSLYLLVLTGPRWLGAITPMGGVCFMVGWLFVAVAAFRSKNPEQPRLDRPVNHRDDERLSN
jgi:uncharacterized membrane protein YgdD (TMEM256/DUF423 family)